MIWCIAVIALTRISAPAPPKIPKEFVRNTFRRSADCDATLSPEFEVFAARTIRAESEAKNRDPLLNILSTLAPTAAFALSGVADEGLEVVSVALADEKESACVCFVAQLKKNENITTTKNTFLRLNEYKMSILIKYVLSY